MPELLQAIQNSLPELSVAGLFLLFFFGTFISEDAACLLAGTAVATGRLSFGIAAAACFFGIFASDILLYAAGRLLGDRVFENRLVKRFLSETRQKKAASWLTDHAAEAVFMSRFMSGLRLPTYLAAGALRTDFKKCALYLLLAAAVWTPILVGTTAFAQAALFPQNAVLGLVLIAVCLRIAFSLSSHRNRRLLVGRIKRIITWEFWPIQIFYAPVVAYVAFLGVKHRGLTVFTAVNPAMPDGGFKGESKNDIYNGLLRSGMIDEFMLPHTLISAGLSVRERLEKAWQFKDDNALSFPLIAKPDMGERGKDVSVVGSFDALRKVISETDADLILQEFVAGEEVSVFYYRYPNQKSGRIFSITEKRFPELIGDGKSTLEELILDDSRAVCMAKQYFAQNTARLQDVPAGGKSVKIIDIGTHSRGAIFVEGDWMRTDELERKVDEICQSYDGFYFGRFDIRTPSIDDLRRGENFKIIELNGVTSESTNIYDPKYSLIDAYRILFRQWRIAFEIGAENIKLRAKCSGIFELLKPVFFSSKPPPPSVVRRTRPVATAD